MADFKSFDFLCRCLSTQNQGACDPAQLRRQICDDRVNWQEVISIGDKHSFASYRDHYKRLTAHIQQRKKQ